jgi:hypothetical protein
MNVNAGGQSAMGRLEKIKNLECVVVELQLRGTNFKGVF